jgi:hypothetical protein
VVASKKTPTLGSKAKHGFTAKKTGAKPRPITQDEATLTVDRRSLERRDQDRRSGQVPVAAEHRGGERRKKVNRRRQIDPTTCERDYTPDEVEFMSAMDGYKRRSGRMFPTCSEVLEVLKLLGYEKCVKAAEIAPPPPSPGLPVSMPENPVAETLSAVVLA